MIGICLTCEKEIEEEICPEFDFPREIREKYCTYRCWPRDLRYKIFPLGGPAGEPMGDIHVKGGETYCD